LRVRFALAALLLGGTGFLLHFRNHGETFPPRQPLISFPTQFGNWQATDIPISKEELDILGAGEFIMRDYRDQAESNPLINLYIAYFPSQQTHDTIHSPKHCLPGNGWAPVHSDKIQVAWSGHAPFSANRYVIANGDERRLVIYWFWAHDRAVASEYWAKFYLVADSLRLHRSDGSLIRVMTPLLQNETEDAAQQRLLSFADGNIAPLIDQYIPK
jgi:EpsI family protein